MSLASEETVALGGHTHSDKFGSSILFTEPSWYVRTCAISRKKEEEEKRKQLQTCTPWLYAKRIIHAKHSFLPPISCATRPTRAPTPLTTSKIHSFLYPPIFRYQGYYSPFYNESHRTFRASTRTFVETHIKPFVDQWVEEGEYPKSLHKLAHEHGISTVIYRAAADYYTAADGPSPSTYDAFHELILWDEL